MIMQLSRKHLKSTGKHISVLILAVFLSVSGNAQDSVGFVVDEVIAKVDNYIVLKSDLDRAYQQYLAEGNRPSLEERCKYLQGLIVRKLMLARAEIDSVTVDDADVDRRTDQRIQLLLSQYGGSVDELEKSYGKSIDQIRAEVRDDRREQDIIQTMQQKITSDVTITPAEVKKFFNQIPRNQLPFLSAEVEVAQIVKVVDVSEAQKQDVKSRLMEIRRRLLDGEDFTTLARQYSEDPSVVDNGGDMGYSGRGVMVPTYEGAALELQRGEISQPIETQFGFHIIQLLDRRGNEYHSRHILISPKPSNIDVKRDSVYLDSLANVIRMDSISFSDAARKYSDDEITKSTGGYLIDPNGELSRKILIDELEPEVFFAINELKEGEISKPIRFVNPEGKQAVRIFYLHSKKPPHIFSLEEDWDRIRRYALNNKQNRVIEEWFDKARKDVFISVNPKYDCGILNN